MTNFLTTTFIHEFFSKIQHNVLFLPLLKKETGFLGLEDWPTPKTLNHALRRLCGKFLKS